MLITDMKLNNIPTVQKYLPSVFNYYVSIKLSMYF